MLQTTAMANKSTSSQLLTALQRTPGNIAGAPVDLANLLAGFVSGRGVGGLVPGVQAVGGSDWINSKFGLTEKGDTAQQSAEAVASLATPGGIAKGAVIGLSPLVATMLSGIKGAKAAAMAGPGAKQAGMIVPAKVLNFSNAKAAEKLIDSGAAKEAWKKYGVYRDNVDGQLKSVLSDAGAKFKDGALKATLQGNYGKGPVPWYSLINDTHGAKDRLLSDVLEHPALEKALPDIYYGLKISPSSGMGYRGAYYKGKVDLTAGTSQKDMMSTMLHEIQHGVQDNYGFATGGNSREFIRRADSMKEIETALKKISDKRYDDKLEKIIPGSLLANINRVALVPGKEAFKRYEQIPGEVEARTVQKMFENNNYRVNPQALQLQEYRKLGPVAPYRWTDDMPEYKALESALRDLGFISTSP